MTGKINCDLLIEHASCLMGDLKIHDEQVIAIKDGYILDIVHQKEGEKRYDATDKIQGKNKIWMPGLIDAHMHTGQQLLKGRILDELPMIWTRIMLPFESTLTPEKMQLSAELAALEMIQSGTTGFVESGGYFMEDAAEVYSQSGLRGALSYSTMNQGNFPDSIRQTTEEAVACTDSLYRNYHDKGNLKVFYSLRALMNCSSDLIIKAAEQARQKGTMLQAHMNEYAAEVNYTLEKFSLRPVEYLDSLGILGEHFLAVHGIMLSPAEMTLLEKYHAKVVHCPFSNCGKGVPNTPALLEKGICVGLGTDGAAHGGLSLWNEMKIFRSVMNAAWGTQTANPAIMPAETILKMATEGGAAILDESGRLGCLKPGYKADIISIDWSEPRLFATANRIHTLLECVDAGDVRDSIVAGKCLMKDREILTLDAEKIYWKARQYFSGQTEVLQ